MNHCNASGQSLSHRPVCLFVSRSCLESASQVPEEAAAPVQLLVQPDGSLRTALPGTAQPALLQERGLRRHPRRRRSECGSLLPVQEQAGRLPAPRADGVQLARFGPRPARREPLPRPTGRPGRPERPRLRPPPSLADAKPQRPERDSSLRDRAILILSPQ